jgi:hypothetical protein
MQDFLDRTLLVLGNEGIEALSTPLVALSGLGGVGGGTFLNLVRSGVKRFRLAENGVFDAPDMNRQAAAFASTLGRPKIEVYEELARGINPEVELELFPEGLLAGNIERFLEGSDVNIGVIDVEKGADVKAMTPDLIKRFNIPLFSAMVVGFGTVLVAHHPKGMMPGEFWGLVRKRSSGARFPSFLSGRFGSTVAQRIEISAEAGKGPSTSIGGAFAGAILASEVMAHILRGTDLVNREAIFAPRFIVVDPMGPTMEVVDVMAP